MILDAATAAVTLALHEKMQSSSERAVTIQHKPILKVICKEKFAANKLTLVRLGVKLCIDFKCVFCRLPPPIYPMELATASFCSCRGAVRARALCEHASAIRQWIASYAVSN